MKTTTVMYVKDEVVIFMQVVLQVICMQEAYMVAVKEFIDTKQESLKLGSTLEKLGGNKEFLLNGKGEKFVNWYE
jgi:hypothetical protein